ncbi:MAG: hypothetical protein E3J54_01225, partial [Actinobacteria bacterium]
MSKIDFIGRSKIWLVISIVVFAFVTTTLIVRHTTNGFPVERSIEFTGGSLVTVKTGEAVKAGDVRKLLKPLKLSKSIIQPVGNDSVMIRYNSQKGQN